MKNEFKEQKRWLITGVAGFIGTNLLIKLLNNNQKVTGIDNFFSGKKSNLNQVKKIVGSKNWKNFSFYKGDICELEDCIKVMKNVDYILHHAALVSVPKSIKEPKLNNNINVNGFLNILLAAQEFNVERIVYASSSAVYGDGRELPKKEDSEIKPLSPYAISKVINEQYAKLFSKFYEMQIVGLRYFNVYGPFQDENGDYAAVIPKWIENFKNNKSVIIYGDGESTRDFCHVAEIVNANILTAQAEKNISGEVFNVGNGKKISLNQLFKLIKNSFEGTQVKPNQKEPKYESFRDGDIKESYASINKIRKIINFNPKTSLESGMKNTVAWFVSKE